MQQNIHYEATMKDRQSYYTTAAYRPDNDVLVLHERVVIQDIVPLRTLAFPDTVVEPGTELCKIEHVFEAIG